MKLRGSRLHQSIYRSLLLTSAVVLSAATIIGCGNATSLSNLESRHWSEFRQIDRIRYIETAVPNPGIAHAAVDYLENRPRSDILDILVVVDNSGSMAEEQTNLSTKLAPLLSFVQNADWRIHVVTTSTSCPSTTINKTDVDAAQRFARAVLVGTNGDPNERGVKMAREALENPCQGTTWLRPNSNLAILILSDEDNCSDGAGCNGEGAWSSANYLYDYLATIRNPGINARVYGILFHPTMNMCSGAGSQAHQYADLIARTGGVWGSICQADFTTTLQGVSQNAATLIAPIISLGNDPVAGSLTVTVDGQPLAASEYTLVGREVHFARNVQQGQRIVVNFDYLDGRAPGSITLLHPASPETIRVYVQDHFVDPTQFSFDAAPRTLLMAPGFTNDETTVIYRENLPLRTIFPYGPLANPASLRCYLDNGTLMTGVQYDASTESIMLGNPPADGELFRCTDFSN